MEDDRKNVSDIEYYSAIKWNKVLKYTIAWMNL